MPTQHLRNIQAKEKVLAWGVAPPEDKLVISCPNLIDELIDNSLVTPVTILAE
jgi:hypothetical protein